MVGLDRGRPLHPPAAVECICMDLTSDESVRPALQRVRIGYGERLASAIHLAACFDLTGEPDPRFEAVTVDGTERLLRELTSFQLEQFVFASTMRVHVPGKPGERIDEDWPLDPQGLPYRESKLRTERLIHEQRGSIPAVFVCPAGVYDDQSHAAFLAHQIARVNERKLSGRVYPGDLDTGQSYLHLDALTDALLRSVERRKELLPELALLLGEPETLTFRELQEQLGCLIHGEEWETIKVPRCLARIGAWIEDVLDVNPFIRPWMVDISSDHYELDITRARTLPRWEPHHSLHATQPKIVAALKVDSSDWHRANKLNPAVLADRAPEPYKEHGAMQEIGGEQLKHQRMMLEHMQQMRRMHFSMLWVHFANLLLGAWLAASPLIFGGFDPQSFTDAVLGVTAERGLPDPPRSEWLAWNDFSSGLAIVLFSALSLSQRFSSAQWAIATVGVWLLFAPLVF